MPSYHIARCFLNLTEDYESVELFRRAGQSDPSSQSSCSTPTSTYHLLSLDRSGRYSLFRRTDSAMEERNAMGVQDSESRRRAVHSPFVHFLVRIIRRSLRSLYVHLVPFLFDTAHPASPRRPAIVPLDSIRQNALRLESSFILFVDVPALVSELFYSASIVFN